LKVGNPLKKVISGGQRKRLNIALELIRQPSVLFVDEPTSGLSSVDSEVVMNLLKEQTYRGKIVVVNIHQPGSDIFKMFDRIMIIDRGGHQVYYGNPNEAIVYFRTMTGHANPDEDLCVKCGNIDTDELLRIIEARVMDEHGKPTRIRKVAPEEWAERFRQSVPAAFEAPQRNREPVPENMFSIPGLLRQSKIFLHRDILSKLADRQYLLISLAGPPLLAALLAWFTKSPEGAAYSFSANENIPAFMFMAVITSLFFGLMISSQEIVRDRKILKRESFLNLSWFSYLASKVSLLFFISAIQTFSFIIIGNGILEIRGMTFSYWLILFATACSANMLGLIISSAFSSLITIYIVIPFIIIPQLLFSGVLVKFDRLHLTPLSSREYVPLIGNMMTARWAFEAMAVKQFRDNDYEKHFFDYNADESRFAYYASWLIPMIRSDLQTISDNKRNSNNSSMSLKLAERAGSYTDMLSREAGLGESQQGTGSTSTRYSAIINDKAVERLDTLRKIFLAHRKTAGMKKDSVSRLLENSMGREALVSLREKHENKRLKQTVIDLDFGAKIRAEGLKYISSYNPGYMKASSPWGRAHFYAPAKHAGKTEIHTTVFDLAVIWTVTLLLFIILCFNLPVRIIDYFSSAGSMSEG
ncbi:MAG: ABC transporter permease, partial [Bacteroidales bacterium]|nr:ABC transporter permease [Bacteroidales bacterium]